MEGRPTVGSLVARLGLTGQLLGQIFLTPMAAFSLTYLLVFSAQGGDFRLSIEVDMVPWIGMASLFYGMLALTLALGMGGFMPMRVIEAGGWRLAFGLTRHKGNSVHRFEARKRYASSAHGRLSLLVHERFAAGHALWTTRGSLVLLAIPFQVMLATIPLTLVLMFPDGVVHQNRQLELALFLYCICLFASIHVPRVCEAIHHHRLAWAKILGEHAADFVGLSGVPVVVHGAALVLHRAADARRRCFPQHRLRKAIV